MGSFINLETGEWKLGRFSGKDGKLTISNVTKRELTVARRNYRPNLTAKGRNANNSNK